MRNARLEEAQAGIKIAGEISITSDMQMTQAVSLGWEDPLEKEMTTHSSHLAWRIASTEEPGGLQSRGLQKSQIRLSD